MSIPLLTDQEEKIAVVRAMWQDLIRNPLDESVKGIIADYIEDNLDSIGDVEFSASSILAIDLMKEIRGHQAKTPCNSFAVFPPFWDSRATIDGFTPITERVMTPFLLPTEIAAPRVGVNPITVRELDGLPALAEVTADNICFLAEATVNFPIKRVVIEDANPLWVGRWVGNEQFRFQQGYVGRIARLLHTNQAINEKPFSNLYMKACMAWEDLGDCLRHLSNYILNLARVRNDLPIVDFLKGK